MSKFVESDAHVLTLLWPDSFLKFPRAAWALAAQTFGTAQSQQVQLWLQASQVTWWEPGTLRVLLFFLSLFF